MKHIKYIKILFAFFLAIIFIFLPQTPANLYIRIHFETIQSDHLQLYYTTNANGQFCEEQSITSSVDLDTRTVSFCLNRSLYDQITNLRLDFAPTAETLIINGVTISSGGVVKKEWNPGELITTDNIAITNDVAFSSVPDRNKVFVVTQDSDPYFIFSPVVVQQIISCYSLGHVTRFFIFLLVLSLYLSYKSNFFKSTKELV